MGFDTLKGNLSKKLFFKRLKQKQQKLILKKINIKIKSI